MTYNSANGRALTQFLRFCESKPGDQAYDWYSSHRCACGQFFDIENWHRINEAIYHEEGIDLNQTAYLGRLGDGTVPESTFSHLPKDQTRWTFGNLTARLKELV